MTNHIKNTNAGEMFCGTVAINENDFYFKDIEQAVINGLHGERPLCGICVENILKCLTSKGLQYQGVKLYETSEPNTARDTPGANT